MRFKFRPWGFLKQDRSRCLVTQGVKHAPASTSQPPPLSQSSNYWSQLSANCRVQPCAHPEENPRKNTYWCLRMASVRMLHDFWPGFSTLRPSSVLCLRSAAGLHCRSGGGNPRVRYLIPWESRTWDREKVGESRLGNSREHEHLRVKLFPITTVTIRYAVYFVYGLHSQPDSRMGAP